MYLDISYGLNMIVVDVMRAIHRVFCFKTAILCSHNYTL